MTRKYTRLQLKSAVDDVINGNLTIRDAEREHRVPRATISDHKRKRLTGAFPIKKPKRTSTVNRVTADLARLNASTSCGGSNANANIERTISTAVPAVHASGGTNRQAFAPSVHLSDIDEESDDADDSSNGEDFTDMDEESDDADDSSNGEDFTDMDEESDDADDSSNGEDFTDFTGINEGSGDDEDVLSEVVTGREPLNWEDITGVKELVPSDEVFQSLVDAKTNGCNMSDGESIYLHACDEQDRMEHQLKGL